MLVSTNPNARATAPLVNRPLPFSKDKHPLMTIALKNLSRTNPSQANNNIDDNDDVETLDIIDTDRTCLPSLPYSLAQDIDWGFDFQPFRRVKA